MGRWYSRPVLFVTDIDRASGFYVQQLGFVEAWRHVEDLRPIVAQVERDGCELILSSQAPEKAGRALIFLSLDPADIPGLRESLREQGVQVKDGWWGYPVMIVQDSDGNQLYFAFGQ